LDKNNPTIDFIEKLENQLIREKNRCLEEEYQLFSNIETKLKTSKKDIEIASERKSIIIDTNILLEEPQIIEIIGQHQTIILSGKVIDELDNLKMKPALKDKAQEAIRRIHKHQKDKNIRFNTSKLENLPSDFNKKSPDNIILSVALQYLKRNPILLTNDKGMNIKAKTLGIPAKTINELKAILDLSKVVYSSKNKKNTNRNKKRK
jgi:predicted ribonuclease YlaK